MRPGVAVTIVLSVGLGLAAPARAAEPAGEVAATAAAPAPPTTAANLLAAADAAVDAGNLELARSLYERIAGEFPGAPEAVAARRALKIIAASARPAPARADAATPSAAVPAPGAPAGAAAPEDVVVRGEPYSVKTSERLRLTAWEKLDFGTTAFLYGMLGGLYYGLSLDHPTTSQVMAPIALGALAYTAGAVLFLKLADPDRGDLPLALAITSYVPTTTLLVANLAFDHPNQRTAALAAAGVGLLSIPAAVLATRELNLDPGDTQLVRDAGFWGLALAVAGMEGFGGSTQVYSPGGGVIYSNYQSPTGRAVAGAGLAGLYGGMGLGLVGAHFSDVSLERVRVTTWGGYGGAVIGLLIGASMDNGSTQSIYRGLSVGALAGLVVTFLATSSLDGIPPEDLPTPHAAVPRVTPLMLQLAGSDGQSHPALGFAGLF